jgi:hypothetical protein
MTDRELKNLRRDVHYAALPNRIGMGVFTFFLILAGAFALELVIATVFDAAGSR